MLSRLIFTALAVQASAIIMGNDPQVHASIQVAKESLVNFLTATANELFKMPEQEYVSKNVDFALQARSDIPAAERVPREMFLSDVLPYRMVDEPLDNWREVMYPKLLPLLSEDMTLKDIAETIIPAVFQESGPFAKKIEFKSDSTPAVMAPISETLEKGYASCTGLSIFLACALRTVGVPARVVGVSKWNTEKGGNHNWLEVYHSGGWHFIDAAPVEKVEWDRAWFTADGHVQKSEAGTLSGIYTPVWDVTAADSFYTIGWRNKTYTLPAKELTSAYSNLQTGDSDPGWQAYRDASEGGR